MTVKLLLIYLLVIAFSLVLLFISISGGKNLRRNEDILAGRFSEANESDAANKNKTKQQIASNLFCLECTVSAFPNNEFGHLPKSFQLPSF